MQGMDEMAEEFLLAGAASYRADCWLQASAFDTRNPNRHFSMDREKFQMLYHHASDGIKPVFG
jgi:hypothetical protein